MLAGHTCREVITICCVTAEALVWLPTVIRGTCDTTNICTFETLRTGQSIAWLVALSASRCWVQPCRCVGRDVIIHDASCAIRRRTDTATARGGTLQTRLKINCQVVARCTFQADCGCQILLTVRQYHRWGRACLKIVGCPTQGIWRKHCCGAWCTGS